MTQLSAGQVAKIVQRPKEGTRLDLHLAIRESEQRILKLGRIFEEETAAAAVRPNASNVESFNDEKRSSLSGGY